MDRLSSKQFKSLCRERGLSTVGCLEKADLVALLERNSGAVMDVVVMTCARCHATATSTGGRLPRCSKCSSVSYCGQECQRAHWSEHKPMCARSQDVATRKRVADWCRLNDNLLMQAARVVFSQQGGASAAAEFASSHGVVVSLEMSAAEGDDKPPALRATSIEVMTRDEIHHAYCPNWTGPTTEPVIFVLRTTDRVRGLVFVETHSAEVVDEQTAEEMLTPRRGDLASIEAVLARMNL